jgi:hypothetical protein
MIYIKPLSLTDVALLRLLSVLGYTDRLLYLEMPAKFNLAPIGNLCIFAPDTDTCIKYVSISDI